MSWFWVPIDVEEPDEVAQVCFHNTQFLGQFLDVINGCTDLYNWSRWSSGYEIEDLDAVAVGDNVQSVSFWDSIQTRIELLIGVAHNYDLVVADASMPDLATPFSLSATVDSVEYKRFKYLANAITPPEHQFSTTPGDGFGWKRVDLNDDPQIGKMEAGDCINVQFFNQLYAACVVLQDFCIILETGESLFPGIHRNWPTDDAYTGYMGNPEDTFFPEFVDEGGGVISGEEDCDPVVESYCQRQEYGGSDPDPDAGYDFKGFGDTIGSNSSDAKSAWATYWTEGDQEGAEQFSGVFLQNRKNYYPGDGSFNIRMGQAWAYRDATWWCRDEHEFMEYGAAYYWNAVRYQFKGDFENLPVALGVPLSIKQFGRLSTKHSGSDLSGSSETYYSPWEYSSVAEDTITILSTTTGHTSATLAGATYAAATSNPAGLSAIGSVPAIDSAHDTGVCDVDGGGDFINPTAWKWGYRINPYVAVKANIPDPTRTEP